MPAANPLEFGKGMGGHGSVSQEYSRLFQVLRLFTLSVPEWLLRTISHNVAMFLGRILSALCGGADTARDVRASRARTSRNTCDRQVGKPRIPDRLNSNRQRLRTIKWNHGARAATSSCLKHYESGEGKEVGSLVTNTKLVF